MSSANSSAPSNLLLSDQQQTIDQQLAQIEARLRLLDEQQSSWEAHKASVQQTLDDRVAGLDALRVDLESQRLVLEKECRQYEVRFAELQLRECELEERRRDLESNLAMAAVSTSRPWYRFPRRSPRRRNRPQRRMKRTRSLFPQPRR